MVKTLAFLGVLAAVVAPNLVMASNLSADDFTKSGVSAALTTAVIGVYKMYLGKD